MPIAAMLNLRCFLIKLCKLVRPPFCLRHNQLLCPLSIYKCGPSPFKGQLHECYTGFEKKKNRREHNRKSSFYKQFQYSKINIRIRIPCVMLIARIDMPLMTEVIYVWAKSKSHRTHFGVVHSAPLDPFWVVHRTHFRDAPSFFTQVNDENIYLLYFRWWVLIF